MPRGSAKVVFFWLASVLLWPTPARANPVVWAPGFSSPEFLGLLSETIIVTVLLRRLGCFAKRLPFLWFFITLTTHWGSLLCFALSAAGSVSIVVEN
jgi:hypothetical protein